MTRWAQCLQLAQGGEILLAELAVGGPEARLDAVEPMVGVKIVDLAVCYRLAVTVLAGAGHVVEILARRLGLGLRMSKVALRLNPIAPSSWNCPSTLMGTLPPSQVTGVPAWSHFTSGP